MASVYYYALNKELRLKINNKAINLFANIKVFWGGNR
jgi:hypothetical protein